MTAREDKINKIVEILREKDSIKRGDKSLHTRIEIIEKIRNGEKNFTVTNLNGVDLSNANLREVSFIEDSLCETNLQYADLGGANFRNANLRKANLSGANAQLSNFSDANFNKTHLCGANLGGANLHQAYFYEADLGYTNLSEANLQGADLRADLHGAIFRGANLRDSDLCSANLNEANLTGADLTGANIWGIAHTSWIIDGITADYVYNYKWLHQYYLKHHFSVEERKRTRVPYDRNFRPGEFEQWLKKMPTMEHIYLDEIPKVFISYCWNDKPTMESIDQWLRNKGARVIVDQRDFISGADIRDEIVKQMSVAGKVICIYSEHSYDRPYPKLERRIAEEREFTDGKSGKTSIILIFFCIDDTPLPQESTHRLAIMAKDKSFIEACEELWAAILEKGKEPKQIDLKQYDRIPPWRKSL